MQFRHPEILWALFLLIVPIIIHLFQLRKFKKTPFTNVKFLKQVVSESRKSKTLKKWLILFTRLAFLTALIVAFAQPFTAQKIALQEKENVYFLDNSFSMNAKTTHGTLLQDAVQDFIQDIPEGNTFTLFTNDRLFKEVTIGDIRNELLALEPSSKQLTLEEAVLKARNYFSENPATQKNVVLISDFQKRMGAFPDAIADITINLVKPSNPETANISIDSLYVATANNENIDLTVLLSTHGTFEDVPVSLYADDKLIAKTAANFKDAKNTRISFTIPSNTSIKGTIAVTDKGLDYDNRFYFNLDAQPKIKVLSVNQADNRFLSRIFTDDEFLLTQYALNQLPFGDLEEQDLIILNELETIPNALQQALKNFALNDGSLLVIPAKNMDLTSYNQFSLAFGTQYGAIINTPMAITHVTTTHPLYRQVFENKVANFQYPTSKEHYKIRSSLGTALSYQNNDPFLVGNNRTYFFASALSKDHSNFKSSPLIVPSLYNMGTNSLQLPLLYHTIGEPVAIDVPISLSKDKILEVANNDMEFIPIQQAMPKKVKITFTENPQRDGIYAIKNGSATLQNISFNYNREESVLDYMDIHQWESANSYDTLSGYFTETQKNNSINEFWKWFAILALLMVLLETALQKFLK